ncbi:MAG: hypothetical protein WA687_13645 [Solirubrobacterales bacterium]
MLEEERGHGEALDSRLGQLTGFAGIILTLIAPLGAEHLKDGNGALFDLFYISSVSLLAGSALLAVTVGLRTRIVKIGNEEIRVPWRRRFGVEAEFLDQFGGALTGEPTVAVEKKMVETTVESIKDQRELNGLKGEVLRFVSFGVAVALLAVGAQAFILAL